MTPRHRDHEAPSPPWFEETLHPHVREKLAVSRVVLHQRSPHQEIMIFDNDTLGRVLVLDGIVQTTQNDEYIYHEMLAHVPVFAHGHASDILIVGGGDGGCLREVLKHPVRRVTLVDIDRVVIDVCAEHMPFLSQGAFTDSRTRIVIDDGQRFLSQSGETFDVIIVDSPDPVGPGVRLFSHQFITACHGCLKDNGILVSQNGTPFLQGEDFVSSHRIRREIFADSGTYVAPAPSYHGGFMAFGWGCDDPGVRRLSHRRITQRIPKGFATRYYNAGIHGASFVLPNDLRALMNNSADG